MTETTTGREVLQSVCDAFLTRRFKATSVDHAMSMYGRVDAFLSFAEGLGITSKERLTRTGGWIATPVVRESSKVPGAFTITESDRPSRTQKPDNCGPLFASVVGHVRKEAQYLPDDVVIDVAPLLSLLSLGNNP